MLGDVRLSFLRGAKIGVLGVNGSGKSTLLKVISGKCEQRGERDAWQPDILRITSSSSKAS